MNRFACLLLVLLALPARGAEILGLEVEYDEGVYTMSSSVWFDASVEQIYEVFRYWDYSTQFSSAIVESRDIEPGDDGRAGFYVRNRGCVLFFCTSFERQGFVEAEINTVIYASTDPEVSDFHLCEESWRFEQRDGGTVVVYDLEMTPKFWVPPGIGPYFIKRKMKNNAGEAADRIEDIARGIEQELQANTSLSHE